MTRGARAGARRFALAAIAAAASLMPSAAPACPSCYGSSAGPVIDGMNLAVLVMIGVTGGVFSWIISFAVRIARRERPGPPQASTTEGDPTDGRDGGGRR
jgi:heme/copper-type cytochrome/quinol oxidase subunit 2